MTADISLRKVRNNNNKINFSQGWHLDWLSLLTAPETLPQCWCLTSWRLWTEMESFHRLDLKQLINTVSVFLRLGFGPHITAHDIQSWKKSDGWRRDCSWSRSPARDFYISGSLSILFALTSGDIPYYEYGNSILCIPENSGISNTGTLWVNTHLTFPSP